MECMGKPDAEIEIDTLAIVPTTAKELSEINDPGYNPNNSQQYTGTYGQSTGDRYNPYVQQTNFGGQSAPSYYAPNDRNHYGNNSFGGNNPPQYPENHDYVYVDMQRDSGTFAPSFETQAIRNKFIRKVYLILSVQLLFFGGLVALFVFEPNVRKCARSNTFAFYIPSMVLFMVTYFVLICNTKLRRKVPLNFCLLFVMTFALALTAATVSAMYNTYIVVMSFGLVSAVCLLITAAAWFNIFDMTKYRAYLFVASCVMLVLMVIWMIMSFFIRTTIFTIVIISIMTILLAMYLMYDTQLIIGGKKHKHELSAEEYILGAILLYVDIAHLFMYILMLVGICRH